MEEAKNKKFIIPAKFESAKGETYATGHIKNPKWSSIDNSPEPLKLNFPNIRFRRQKGFCPERFSHHGSYLLKTCHGFHGFGLNQDIPDGSRFGRTSLHRKLECVGAVLAEEFIVGTSPNDVYDVDRIGNYRPDR